ncbi:MAG: GntR family transcriptional regulator [Betaproteobacteria bacterium]
MATSARRPVHEDVRARLRDMIVEGELPAGAHIPESSLCERFGISRTPLREALKALAAEGLVTLLPNRGAIVAALTLKDVEDVFKVVDALESLAAPSACEQLSDAGLRHIESLHVQMVARRDDGDLMGYFKLNQAIHEAIVEAAGNPVASTIYRSLLSRIQRYRFVGNTENERWARALAEHEQFLDALRQRDGALLRQLLHSHLRNGWQVSRELVREELEANERRPLRILRRPPRAA